MGKARNKGNRFEQDRGKWLLEVDGPCPKWGSMASECARIGHITELGVDVISNTYVCECKHRDSAPKWLMDAWKQIVEKSELHGKEAFLAVKKDLRKYPLMHIITERHHADLIAAAQERDRLRDEVRMLREMIADKND